MRPVFATRRRAEEFQTLLEESSSGRSGTSTGADAELAALVALVAEVRSAPAVHARPEFVGSLRERLMAEAPVALATPVDSPASQEVRDKLTVAPGHARRERRMAIALGGFAVVTATTSMAVAAQSSLPGETLYPLKRAIENAQTSLTVGEEDRGAALLARAGERLNEVDALVGDGAEPEVVAQTLQDFSDQADTAGATLIEAYENDGDAADIELVRGFTGESMAALGDLEATLPEAARPSLITAAQTLARIDERAFRACPGCTGGGIGELPEFAQQAYAATDEADGPGAAKTPDTRTGPGRDRGERRDQPRERADRGDGSGNGNGDGGQTTSPETPQPGNTIDPSPPVDDRGLVPDLIGGILGDGKKDSGGKNNSGGGTKGGNGGSDGGLIGDVLGGLLGGG